MIYRLLMFVALFLPIVAHADGVAMLNSGLQKTYMSCMGIDDLLGNMKKIAGINTGVTGVGTAAGAGAVVVGIKNHDELFGDLRDLEAREDFSGSGNVLLDIKQQSDFKPNIKSKKSKNLGNWRTGLLAANTAANVAGAILATKNTSSDDELNTRVGACISAVNDLQNIIIQARANGVDVTEAQKIYDACSEYKYVDLSKIKKRGRGAQISSVAGGVVGGAGIVSSQIANNPDQNNAEKIDTAANVLAGGATALSGAATVFNATQISAIKKVADVAQNCEKVLK
ncbi:MAG: hypothetical protein J6W41_01695 [Alphaproteobacteria bacterium]|nr:hypothetical protein [Alphaproteobacteria bacterium]